MTQALFQSYAFPDFWTSEFFHTILDLENYGPISEWKKCFSGSEAKIDFQVQGLEFKRYFLDQNVDLNLEVKFSGPDLTDLFNQW